MHKTILLTGANGLLGQKVLQLLAGRNYTTLYATSKGVNRSFAREGYMYQSLDITDSQELRNIFQETRPTHVIHTAAQTQVDYCEVHREECDATNYEAVKDIASLCKTYNSHLVHLSTDFIFDGENGPYKEGDLPNPVNYYGLSKLKAEQAIQAAGISHSILRTILLYGVAPAISRSNIVLWAKDSLEKGKTINVVNDQFRSPTLVEDLAIATIAATMKQAPGVFHISGAEFMSIAELVYTIADFWGLDRKLITEIDSTNLKQAATRPPKTGFVILKAQTELGYQPRSLQQGLALVGRQLREAV